MVISNQVLRLSWFLVPAAALLAANLSANAAIYTYKDANGNTVYSDQPPPGASTTTTGGSTTPSTTSSYSTIIQKELMPAVDVSKNMVPVTGYSTLLIKNTGEFPVAGSGDFRIDCKPSHMNNDDPIVFPNQKNAAPHHTYFGNSSVNAQSDINNLANIGNSTCRGGIANRSAYWVPSMIDTSSKAALVPDLGLWYYKSGLVGYTDPVNSHILPPPKALKLIAGNPKAKSEAEAHNISYICRSATGQVLGKAYPTQVLKQIPACPQGGTIIASVSFPQCWDGKNLDSADHISHMSYDLVKTASSRNGQFIWKYSCPATHPVAIPAIGLHVYYKVTSAEGTKNWRLSSDNYQKTDYNSGYSMHGGWVNGWDEKVIQGVVSNCVTKAVNCGNHKLGDGRVIYKQ